MEETEWSWKESDRAKEYVHEEYHNRSTLQHIDNNEKIAQLYAVVDTRKTAVCHEETLTKNKKLSNSIH